MVGNRCSAPISKTTLRRTALNRFTEQRTVERTVADRFSETPSRRKRADPAVISASSFVLEFRSEVLRGCRKCPSFLATVLASLCDSRIMLLGQPTIIGQSSTFGQIQSLHNTYLPATHANNLFARLEWTEGTIEN